MKPKTLMLMGVAIVCGLVASYMTSRLIAEKNETVKVLVSKSTLAQWTPVREPVNMFVEEDRPKNQVPPTYIPPAAIAEMKDRPLIKNMKKGQIVTWDDLQDKNKAGLEALLPKGKRAFAIETNAKSAAGGFILPGSHVDLILVTRGGAGDSRYVGENVLVRAIDMLPVRPDDRPGVVPSTVTLELTPEEALKLSKVVTQGQIMLTLRPFGDSEKSADMVSQAPPPPPPIPEPVVEVDPMTNTPVVEKPKDRDFIQQGFDGTRWVRFKYVLDKDGNVKSGPIQMPIGTPVEGNDEPSSPVTPTSPSETELPVPGVSNN